MNHDLFLPRKSHRLKRPWLQPGAVIPGPQLGSWWSRPLSGRSAGSLFGGGLGGKNRCKLGKKDGKKTVKMVEHHGKNHEDGGKQFTKPWKWLENNGNTMNMVESRWKQLWEYGDSWKLCDGSPANIANSSGFVKRRVVLWLEISDLT